jgi:hypothetical protein
MSDLPQYQRVANDESHPLMKAPRDETSFDVDIESGLPPDADPSSSTAPRVAPRTVMYLFRSMYPVPGKDADALGISASTREVRTPSQPG